MHLLQGLVQGLQKQGEVAAIKADRDKDVKLTKLTERDDIEAYLTTFERLMTTYEIKQDKWSFKLAPQLIGKAQQAYAALTTEEAADYEKLKKAILIRYDINEESYRKQFRTAKKAANRELKARLDNLAAKWRATAADVRDKVVMEQLIDTLPLAVKIFVKERHPENSEEAAKYADDYWQARKGLNQEKGSGRPL